MEKEINTKETYNQTMEYIQNTLNNFNDPIEKTKYITRIRKFITQTEYEDKVNNFNSFSTKQHFTKPQLKLFVANYITSKVMEDMMGNINVIQYDCFVELTKESCDEAKQYCIQKQFNEQMTKLNIRTNEIFGN